MKTTTLVQNIAWALLFLGMAISPARAQYNQDFDSGAATFSGNSIYWTDTAYGNGFIIQSTLGAPGYAGTFGASITHDVSGSGYFLFFGTGSGPADWAYNEFFIGPTFSVDAHTDYNISFYLTNADTINVALVQPEIDGTILGSAVSAGGDFTSGWQEFTFSWNSGSNTDASLILHDLTSTAVGNDFGIDDISVTAVSPSTPPSVPEPANLSLLAVFCTATAGFLARRCRISPC